MKSLTMRILWLGCLCAVAMMAQNSAAGKWKYDDGKGKIVTFKVWEEGGGLFGMVENMSRGGKDVPEEKCVKCTESNKDKPIVGMRIIWGMKKAGEKWEGGKIIDPDSGKTYGCKIEVASGGKELKVKGTIGPIGKTQTWTRLE